LVKQARIEKNLYTENSSKHLNKAPPLALQRALHVKDFETPLDKKMMFHNNPASI